MKLKSSAFMDGTEIPQKHGKNVTNISVPLSWENLPKGTRSLAISMLDKLSETRIITHWLVYNIPVEIYAIDEGASGHDLMPLGSKELKVYSGPLPPTGTHTYEFTLFALNEDHIDIPKKASLATFLQIVSDKTLKSAKIAGTFKQNRK